MIPQQLRISGFLSYHDLVELDFTKFDLACISGHNGAGKSSLLDAITWSLFGEARGKSSDVLNLRQDVKAAEVALTFQHEENTYRVQRTLHQGAGLAALHITQKAYPARIMFVLGVVESLCRGNPHSAPAVLFAFNMGPRSSQKPRPRTAPPRGICCGSWTDQRSLLSQKN